MTESSESSQAFAVASVTTTNGPTAAVFAAHPVIADRLIEVFAALDNLTEAYTAYKNSPQEIISLESGIIDAEVISE